MPMPIFIWLLVAAIHFSVYIWMYNNRKDLYFKSKFMTNFYLNSNEVPFVLLGILFWPMTLIGWGITIIVKLIWRFIFSPIMKVIFKQSLNQQRARKSVEQL